MLILASQAGRDVEQGTRHEVMRLTDKVVATGCSQATDPLGGAGTQTQEGEVETQHRRAGAVADALGKHQRLIQNGNRFGQVAPLEVDVRHHVQHVDDQRRVVVCLQGAEHKLQGIDSFCSALVSQIATSHDDGRLDLGMSHRAFACGLNRRPG